MESLHQDEAIASKLEKALRHPLRAWVLAQLNDAPAAAVDLEKRSAQFGRRIPRNRISYHIHKLVKWDCAELIDTQKVRGTEKKIYRAKTRVLITQAMWERMELDARNGISIEILNEGVERAQMALEGGTFDKRIDRIAANYKPRLDDEGWAEAVAMLRELHQEFYEELEARAIERHPDPMDRRPITFSMYLYESPPGR